MHVVRYHSTWVHWDARCPSIVNMRALRCMLSFNSVFPLHCTALHLSLQSKASIVFNAASWVLSSLCSSSENAETSWAGLAGWACWAGLGWAAVFCILYSVFCILYSVFCILYAVHSIQYSVCCILYSACSIQYFHYTALHYSTVHYTTLYYTTLYYTTPFSSV